MAQTNLSHSIRVLDDEATLEGNLAERDSLIPQTILQLSLEDVIDQFSGVTPSAWINFCRDDANVDHLRHLLAPLIDKIAGDTARVYEIDNSAIATIINDNLGRYLIEIPLSQFSKVSPDQSLLSFVRHFQSSVRSHLAFLDHTRDDDNKFATIPIPRTAEDLEPDPDLPADSRSAVSDEGLELPQNSNELFSELSDAIALSPNKREDLYKATIWYRHTFNLRPLARHIIEGQYLHGRQLREIAPELGISDREASHIKRIAGVQLLTACRLDIDNLPGLREHFWQQYLGTYPREIQVVLVGVHKQRKSPLEALRDLNPKIDESKALQIYDRATSLVGRYYGAQFRSQGWKELLPWIPKPLQKLARAAYN
ncbi:MAG: hypothetical protein KDD53_06610, partial [Bdellovibrionales bacterium]|nr:hypothetical protein [Bdellovibrionales bacterium]